MVLSLEHDIKVTKNHQNLLPSQSVLVAHTVNLPAWHKTSTAIVSSDRSPALPNQFSTVIFAVSNLI
jgi:hypothetical protein